MKKLALLLIAIFLSPSLTAQWTTSGSDIYYSSGDVGIGISAPESPLSIKSGANSTSYYNGLSIWSNLDISKIRASVASTSSDNGQFNLYDSNTNADVILRANGDSFISGGNVGIGTSLPTARLEVNSSSETISKFVGSDSDRTRISILNTSTGSAELYLDGSNGDLVGSDYASIIHDNSTLDLNIVNRANAGDINIDAQGGQVNIDSNVFFDGGVGIGTDDPDKSLVINTTTNTDGIRINGSAANAGLIIQNSGSGGMGWAFSSTGSGHGAGEGKLILYNDDDFGVGDEIMVFDSDGKMGLGTTDPTTELDIVGQIKQTGSEFIFDHIDKGNLVRNAYYDDGWKRLNEDHAEMLQMRDGGYEFQSASFDVENGAISWTELLTIKKSGNVGIGTNSPDQKLTVKGKIHSEEIVVDLNVPGPDYVFEPDYDLTTLAELEAFIQANKHLPEIPSAATMEEEGIILGEMNMLLLKKIEELTLYTIEQQKIIQEETNKNIDQQEVIEMLIKRIETLENEN